MRNNPGDFYTFYKTKQADWPDWATSAWESIKHRIRPSPQFGPTEPPQFGPTEPPQFGTSGQIGPASPFPRQFTPGQRVMQGVKGGLGALGKSFITGAVGQASDAVAHGAIKRMSGEPNNVDPVAERATRAVHFAAPFLPKPAAVAATVAPAVLSTAGAGLGTLAGPSSGEWYSRGAPTPAVLGPAALRHPAIKERAETPLDAEPKTQADLAGMHKRDPFSVSFGPGQNWESGKVTGQTEYKLNAPKPLR